MIRSRTQTPVGLFPFAALLLGLALVATCPAATPVITTFTPTAGRAGTHVTINGTDFSDSVKVEFGDQRVAAFVRVSANQLAAVVPEDGLSGPIRVTSAGGQVGTSAGTFYVGPRLDDFMPRRGSSSTTITINGANFISGVGTTLVYFGSTPSPLVTVTATSQLQARVPAGITSAIVSVSTFVGSATSVVEFVVTTLPVIEDFTPENGLPGQSVPVVINGANLLSATSVKFNGVASPFTPTADTQLATTIPATARTGRLTVTSAAGTGTSQVDFVVGPTIDNSPPFFPPFNPMAGKPGDFIVIYGNDFTGLTNVSFNGVLVGPPPNFVQTGQNQVQAKVPAGAKTGKVKVLTTNGEGISAVDFTVGPLVESLSKTNGPVGSQVVVYGAGFVQGGTSVKFGTIAAAAPVFTADTQFTVTVPAGASNAPISVATSLSTNVTPYKFLVTTTIPLIEDFTPKTGPQGTQMQIRGAKFTGATQVTIGGVAVIAPEITADTLILATVPPGVLTGPVRVTNPSGTGVSPQSYQAPPWISSVTPLSGKVGDFVNLQGTNFAGTLAVYFGPAPGVLGTVTANSVLLQVPLAGRSGPLTLIAPGGSFVTTNLFTVLPKLLDFQPRVGPIGASVTITGTSFYNVTNVSFNGVNATYTITSPQEILTTVPVGATTGLIRVGTFDGESFSAIAFTVTQPGDLRVTELQSTNLALPGQQVIYTTTITNLGPTIQSGVRLTNSFQSGLTLHSAVPSQGACGIAGSVVSCALGIITNNRSATVTITVSSPVSGVFTNQVSVRSIEGDPTPSNNTVQNTLVVASLEQRTLNVELLSAPKRVVVSWPVSFVPFKLQTAPDFPPAGAAWTTITPLPQSVNGTNRFTNSAPNANGGYYRLRYP